VASKKYIWTASEIADWMRKYYGVKITWWQRLELWIWERLHKERHFVLWDQLIGG